MTNLPRGETLIVDKGFIYLLDFVPGTILEAGNTLANKKEKIPVLKELPTAVPSIECQGAIEKDHGKARPAPTALSPPRGDRRKVFLVMTERDINSPTGGEHKQTPS